MESYVAIDIGAESGRVLAGSIGGGRLSLEEISRFPNGARIAGGRLRWNTDSLFREIRNSLQVIADSQLAPVSAGIDTWAVDFALLGKDGALIEEPVAYRDSRTDGMMDELFKIIPRESIYEKTGIQFIQINTIYQLFSMSREKSPSLSSACDLLMIPDYLNYLLTGEKTMEFTNATTTQLFNARNKCWDAALMEAIGVSPDLFRPVIQTGTKVGALSVKLCADTGLAEIPVIAPATHDTGSAVAAVPASGGDWAYISSGTWSLIGIESQRPVITPAALKFNFTNEGGVNGTYRVLKNVTGLWLTQAIRAAFDNKFDYWQLTDMAGESEPFRSLVYVDNAKFLNPASMTEQIVSFCRKTRQPEPESPGQFVRCALESLALRYRDVMNELNELRGRPLSRIHVIGGGSKNRLLCQMTADATGIPVLAGPVEATAIGNVIVQAISLGHLDSIAEARALVSRSFELEIYEPRNHGDWDSSWDRYMELKEN